MTAAKCCDCAGFQWAGQQLSTCEGCGHPYWEHTHEELPLSNAGPIGPASDWIQVEITDGQRATARAKWGGR